MDMISKKLANDRLYAYHGGRFWFWDEGRSIWKESHLLAKKYGLNHEYDKMLTPEDFLSDPSQFQALEDYEVDYILKNALQNAQPCQNAPIDPVEETAVVPTQDASPAATTEDKPTAFDYSGLDAQTVDALHMAENQYTQGKKMAETGLRWMVNAVAMAHDTLCGTVVQRLDNGKFAPKDDTSGHGAPASRSVSPLPITFYGLPNGSATSNWTASPFWMYSPPPCCTKQPSPAPRKSWYIRSRPARLQVAQNTGLSSRKISSSVPTG